MSTTELIGMISGGLVCATAFPYTLRVYQRKVRPNITSWSLWALIGLSLLLSYDSSGAGDNLWPAVFGFTNPLMITIVAIWRRGERTALSIWEKFSIVGCLLSLAMWAAVHDSKELSQYALYVGIIADICAAIPTFIFVWSEPDGDRPGMWATFGFAYGLSIFAITDHTFSNYVLPVYMFVGALSITFPMVRYRLKAKIPLAEWV